MNSNTTESATNRFSLRTVFVLIIGLGGLITVVAAPTEIACIVGWLAVASYLLLKQQKTLLWLHVLAPVLGAIVVTCFSTMHVAFADPTTEELAAQFKHFLAEGCLYITIATFPLSFFGVDPG